MAAGQHVTKPGTPSERAPSTPLPDPGRAGQTTSAPPSTVPPADVEFREEMPTYTDPVELEAARVRSTFSSPPPAGEDPTSAERVAAYHRRFGGFDRVPSVVLSVDEVAALSLDGRATMLLGLIDGRSTIQNILDIGIFNAADALAGLQQLLERGVIVMK